MRELIENIRNHPEQWSFDRYIATNDTLKIGIWIGNGAMSCSIYFIDRNSFAGMSN